MDIKNMSITVEELVDGYRDDGESGVTGYGGLLDIRPPFQREFVYKKEQQEAVINTVRKGFPLNIMYWAKRLDGKFEIIDGQQRTISIARYVNNKFALHHNYFHNLTPAEQLQIMDYELTVYICEGTEREKLDWFETINIAGEVLTKQELRNAVYSGPYVSDAKRYFSRTNCPAYGLGSKYVAGVPIRQDYLETAFSWDCGNRDDTAISLYMAKHQNDANAERLWELFQDVIAWIEETFKEYRKEMKRKDWGFLYIDHKEVVLDPDELEDEIKKLMEDDEVKNKAGIYPYVLTREQKHLNIRTFSPSMKRQVFEKQNGECPHCKQEFKLGEMEADHITPWSQGGKTVEENCQVLCKTCNRTKGAR